MGFASYSESDNGFLLHMGEIYTFIPLKLYFDKFSYLIVDDDIMEKFCSKLNESYDEDSFKFKDLSHFIGLNIIE